MLLSKNVKFEDLKEYNLMVQSTILLNIVELFEWKIE